MAGLGGMGFLMQSLGIDAEVINTAARNIIDIGEAVRAQLERIEARLERLENMQMTIVAAVNETRECDVGNSAHDDVEVLSDRTNGARRIGKIGSGNSA